MASSKAQATPLLTVSPIRRLYVDKRLLIEVVTFIVIEDTTVLFASGLIY